jgi:hypothetical protein
MSFADHGRARRGGRLAAMLGATLSLGGPGRVTADVAYGVESDFNARYVFRGLAYSRGPVGQSRAWLEASRLTLYAWTNLVLDPRHPLERLDEIDCGASFAQPVEGWLLEPAVDVFAYRGPSIVTPPSTVEASLRVSRSLGPVRMFVRQTLDVRSYPGAYFGEAGFASSRALSRRTAVAATVSLGWASARFNEAYVGVAKGAANLVAAEVALSYAPSERFQLRPHLALTRVLDRELRGALAEPGILNFGLAVGFTLRPRRSP